MIRLRKRAPMTPPTPEAHRVAPSAPPGLALLGHRIAIDNRGGIRSGARNAEQDAGMAPEVWTTECIASRKTAPGTGSMPKTKGIRKMMPSLPPRPGMMPKNKPDADADRHQHHHVRRQENAEQ